MEVRKNMVKPRPIKGSMMKYTLTLLLLLLALCGKAQIVHFDSSAQMSYVNIDSVKAKFNDPIFCTRLYVQISNDNLNTQCTLYWELRDRFGVLHDRGNGLIVGEDYATWDGNNQFPFEFEADILGLSTHD